MTPLTHTQQPPQRQRQQLAVEAVRRLHQFSQAIAQRPPQQPGGSNTADDGPIALFLSQQTRYAWAVTNMTVCVESIDLLEDSEGVVLARL